MPEVLALITEEPIDEAAIESFVLDARHGALVVFRGIVRDHDHGAAVTALDDPAAKYRDETEAVTALLAARPLSADQQMAVRAQAEHLVRTARKAANRQGVVESFLQEFSLGTREGLALMCLAEALLRTPDEDTRDRLIDAALVACFGIAGAVAHHDPVHLAALLLNGGHGPLLARFPSVRHRRTGGAP